MENEKKNPETTEVEAETVENTAEPETIEAEIVSDEKAGLLSRIAGGIRKHGKKIAFAIGAATLMGVGYVLGHKNADEETDAEVDDETANDEVDAFTEWYTEDPNTKAIAEESVE